MARGRVTCAARNHGQVFFSSNSPNLATQSLDLIRGGMEFALLSWLLMQFPASCGMGSIYADGNTPKTRPAIFPAGITGTRARPGYVTHPHTPHERTTNPRPT